MENCLYCKNKALLDELMIKICDLEASVLYLFREQSHPGRVVLAYKDHVGELFEISEEDYLKFMQDARRVGSALKKLFNPAKVNFGAYSDKLKHAHWHIVPKYEDGFEFGGVFEMNPKKCYLSDEEYAERIEAIKKALKEIV